MVGVSTAAEVDDDQLALREHVEIVAVGLHQVGFLDPGHLDVRIGVRSCLGVGGL